MTTSPWQNDQWGGQAPGGNVVNQGQWSPTPNPTGASGGMPPAGGASPGGAPPQPPSASTVGQPMNPWLERWTGGFTAPLSPYENQSLNGLSGFVGGGMGLGGAQQYLNNTVNGNYLDVANNPNFKQIQNSEDQLLQTQQGRALQELQSRAAAGGDALSGGLMQQEGDYLRNSNAGLQSLMGQLMAGQYSQERGLQSGAANQLQGLANTQLGGYGQLMNQGAVPRQNDTNELLGQYADFVRQTGNMQQASQYPDQQIFNMLHSGYPNSYQMQYQGGGADAITSILGSLLGNGSGGGDLSGIMSLFGGGGGDSGATATDQSAQGADGMVLGHDGPSGYQDWNWYNKALTDEENAHKTQQANAGKSNGLTTGLGVAALLMKLLGGLGQAKKSGSSPFKGGGQPGAGQGKDPNGGKPNPAAYDQPIGPPDPFQVGGPEDFSSNQNLGYPSDTSTSDQWNAMFNSDPGRDLSFNNSPDLSTSTPYDYNQGPDPSLGGGDSNPNTGDMGGFTLDNSGGGDLFGGGDSGGGFDGRTLGYDASFSNDQGMAPQFQTASPWHSRFGPNGIYGGAGIDQSALQNAFRQGGFQGGMGMSGYSPTIDIGGGQMLNTDHGAAFYNHLQQLMGNTPHGQTNAGHLTNMARENADFNRSSAAYGLQPGANYQDLINAVRGGGRYNANNVHEAGYGDSALAGYQAARAKNLAAKASGQMGPAYHAPGPMAPPPSVNPVRPIVDNTGRTTQTTSRPGYNPMTPQGGNPL